MAAAITCAASLGKEPDSGPIPNRIRVPRVVPVDLNPGKLPGCRAYHCPWDQGPFHERRRLTHGPKEARDFLPRITLKRLMQVPQPPAKGVSTEADDFHPGMWTTSSTRDIMAAKNLFSVTMQYRARLPDVPRCGTWYATALSMKYRAY